MVEDPRVFDHAGFFFNELGMPPLAECLTFFQRGQRRCPIPSRSRATTRSNRRPEPSYSPCKPPVVGQREAREAAARTWRATGPFVSRLLYATSYTTAYGVVFPTVLLGRSIPANNAAVQGLIDGVHAAQRKVEELSGSAPASRRPTSVHRPSRTTETKRSVSSVSPSVRCARTPVKRGLQGQPS